MTNTLVFLFFGGVIVVYMSTVFVLSLIKKDNSIVDIAWGLGFVMLAWVGVYGLTNMSVRELALAMLVTVWGMRLAVHIFLRNRGKGEDFRYKAWRESWGKWFVVRSFFQIYMLQGFLMLLVASSFIYTFLVHSTRGFGVFEILGTTIFAIGFLFEAVGDWQLTRFIKNPQNKGAIMQTGLWRFTRHPNYFGEALLWWGVWLFGVGLPGAWWTLVSPLTIGFLLLFVSGIPMLEKKYEGNVAFQEYKKRTSAFFPWFPKK
jgi:steroid 5-alpha reductase family enzyme